MKKLILDLYKKYFDIIPYAVFGVLTTLVNVAAYWVCAHIFNLDELTGTIIAWILAVLFAYLTNRKWVFHSEAKTAGEIFKEVVLFYGCRLATGLIDLGMMYVFVTRLEYNDMLIKIIANIVVIVTNYVASKLLIFKKGEKE